jgi:hypothetical protein
MNCEAAMHSPTTNVAKHLEDRLGPIAFGWADRNSSVKVQVVRFEQQPESNVNTYVTLGLSDWQLNMSRSGRKVRQELLLCATSQLSERDVASALLGIAERCIESGSAVLRGDVIELGRPLLNGTQMSAVYATNPTVFGERLLAVDPEQPPLVFVWLVPVTTDEVDFIRNRSWAAFEAELEAEDPDPWNIQRSSVSAATRGK